MPPLLRRSAPLAAALLLQSPLPAQDPSQGEVPLPCADGWEARLVLDQGDTGVWTVRPFPVFEQYASPELVALDDDGRCVVLVSYSGKWTPLPRVHDGAWLGGLAHGDVDPRVEGAELYTGGKKGNLFQLVPRRHGAIDARLIAHLPGRELHTVLAGELDPTNDVRELLVFTRPGGLFRVTPDGVHGTFVTESLGDLPGRVRDALVLPGVGPHPRIVTASRDGALRLLAWSGGALRSELLHREPMGLGRVALGDAAGGATVLYATLDDGRVLRLAEGDGAWTSETIYAGPQGPRGIACGRFHADPDVESVAVFGYSAKVQLLSRRPGEAWSVATVFEDRDRGHWLTTAELDGRNGTRELVGSGYGGRVFVLARPPGYGLAGAAVEPDRNAAPREGPPRIAVRASRPGMERLSSLSYRGGFQPKTMVYETLVVRDDEGRVAPGLAERWTVEDDGRTFRFVLREGARFHDGTPVDAAAVALHFDRWVGLPEHGWLGANGRIQGVVVASPRELRVLLDEPYALLPDLCAVNPCAIEGPGARDREGTFVRPVGSGPFRLVGAVDGAHRFQRWADGAPVPDAYVDLVAFDAGSERSPVEALRAGAVDVVVDGWYENVPRGGRAERDDLALLDGPGSSVWYLSFRLGGPTASRGLRRAVAAAVDREELVDRVERGHADPAVSWAAPSVRAWPEGRPPTAPDVPPTSAPLQVLVRADEPRERAVAEVLVDQLAGAGIAAEAAPASPAERARRLAAGEYDLCLEHTWGVPYDPFLSLRARFLAPPDGSSASTPRRHGVDLELAALVDAASRVPEEARRAPLLRSIQDRMDAEALVVPLFAPRRLGLASLEAARRIPLGHDLYRTRLEALVDGD